MLLSTFLEPAHLLQTIALAISIFNLAAFLWLAFTVWLNGDRKASIARLGVVGLGLSAFFFFIHALLISSPPAQAQVPPLVTPDFLWHLIWLPALGVPYIWFAIGLHYAALINEGWRRRRPFLLVISGVLGCAVFLLLVLNQSTFTFAGTLRLLAASDAFDDTHVGLFSPPVLLPILFLCYVTFCAIGPWFTLGRIGRLLHALWYTSARKLAVGLHGGGEVPANGMPTLRLALKDAFWDDPADVELLEEPALSWHLARPRLLLAALLMVGLTTTLGILVIQAMIGWLEYGPESAIPASSLPFDGGNLAPYISVLPLNLIVLDLVATGAVAVIILLLGYSIVRHGILIERPLARRGFFEQWRGIVIVATTIAIFIALLVNFTHSNLGGLLLIACLATGAYALFTWSSYTAHDRFIALLRPFVRSSSLRHWLNTDLEKTEQELKNVFFHLCHDVLVVQCAYLTVMAGTVRRSFSYRWPTGADKSAVGAINRPLRAVGEWGMGGDKSAVGAVNRKLAAKDGVASRVQITLRGQPMVCWVLPIYDERGLVATLYLGPREDGAAFTDEDMNLAHACGQRILDTLGDHEAMQAVAGLLRRRIVDVKLLDAQQRRLLHDEILPQMHLALLRLETLRSLPETEQVAQSGSLSGYGSDGSNGHGLADKSAVGTVNRPLRGASIADGAAVEASNGTVGGEASVGADESAVGAINRPLRGVQGEKGRDGGEQALNEAIDMIGDAHRCLAAGRDGGEQALNEAIDMISDAHRRLAAMMRVSAPSAPHRLERDGLMQAIRTMLEQDFQNAFDEVEWCVLDEAAAYIDEITPPAIAELVFAAVQEALRNAARHARGSDVHRRLRLLLKAAWNPADSSLEVIVADDGVGITSSSSSTSGTGGGLLTHSALLAIAGGSLVIKSAPGDGVTVRILLPAESLR